jgi:hypothetical protein
MYLKYIDRYIYEERERERGRKERENVWERRKKTESIVNLDRCLLEREKNPIMR